uniref:Protein FAM193B-like n=1 Tax=Sinocyclocheilus grahami TaxID=75366 RepID=A0A672JWX2_SINGR
EAASSEPRLLEWPQLELERVNSFLTSRLEEIKNTIKDSIRASFSMYDLNLDVNDFPKKAATLEGNHLLSHLNGSSDLQQIDLDLAPLSLRNFKRDLDIVNGWEDTTTAAKDIQRLQSTPSLSKLIRVRSPERSPATGSESIQPGTASAAKPNDANHQTQQQADSQKTGNKRAEEVKACKQSSNGASNGHHNTGSNTQRGKNDLSDTRGNRSEHDIDTKTTSNAPSSQQQAQQPKGKTKNKSKNKTEKSNNTIDDVFLPKDVDPTEMDEIDREVEYFKRFCLDSAKQTRQKVAVNWSNFSLKKMPSNAAQ